MSFFYLRPVKGDLPAHLIEVIIAQRLQHLKSLFSNVAVAYNEYIVEGSVYDNVGHFMLCILTILGNSTGLTQFFMKAELELFRRRLVSLNAYDMRCFAKKMLRNLRKFENLPIFLSPLQLLCQHLMLKDVAHHICSSHSSHCNQYSIPLNFKHCLSFIAKRLVEVKNGVAAVPCGLWKQLLIILFTENLKYRINNTNLDPLKCDPRLLQMLNKVKNDFTLNSDAVKLIKSRDVDNLSTLFPPCMLNLHQNLRKKHRLSHTQRYHFSLFLKDIGMPIEESIEFWKAEYRLAPHGSSCSHNWEKDEKKFLYGIRHMYGLEGCRKNYASVNCQRIQSIDNACSEGGCPFKSFDYDKMLPLLKNVSASQLVEINELKIKKKYSSACMLLLKKNSLELVKQNCDVSFNFTPVKFYKFASKNKSL